MTSTPVASPCKVRLREWGNEREGEIMGLEAWLDTDTKSGQCFLNTRRSHKLKKSMLTWIICGLGLSLFAVRKRKRGGKKGLFFFYKFLSLASTGKADDQIVKALFCLPSTLPHRYLPCTKAVNMRKLRLLLSTRLVCSIMQNKQHILWLFLNSYCCSSCTIRMCARSNWCKMTLLWLLCLTHTHHIHPQLMSWVTHVANFFFFYLITLLGVVIVCTRRGISLNMSIIGSIWRVF